MVTDMVGDIWTCRSHGGPGLAGWCRRQVADMMGEALEAGRRAAGR